MDEPTAPIVDAAALEQKREYERVRKQEQRSKKARADSKADGSRPRHTMPAPAAVRQKLGALGRAVDPIAPQEATRQLYHATVAAGKVLRSDAEFHVDEFEDAGNAFSDLSKVVWPVRLFIRVLVPLVLVGALWQIGAKLVTNTPWWRRLQEKRQKEEAAKGQAPELRILPEAAQQGEPLPPQTGALQFRRNMPNVPKFR